MGGADNCCHINDMKAKMTSDSYNNTVTMIRNVIKLKKYNQINADYA